MVLVAARQPVGPIGRPVLAAGVAALATAVMVANGAVRAVEAAVAGATTGLVTGTDTFVNRGEHVYYWAVGTDRAFGTVVAPSCSSAFLIGPLLLVLVPFLLGRRIPLRRAAVAGAVSVAVVFAANVGRLTLISWAAHAYGFERSFDLTHTVVGSAVTATAAVAALAVLLGVLLVPGRAARGGG